MVDIDKKFVTKLMAISKITPMFVAQKGNDFVVMRGTTNPTTSNMVIMANFDQPFPEDVRFENVMDFIRMIGDESSVRWESDRAVIIDKDDNSLRVVTYIHKNAAPEPKPQPNIEGKYDLVAKAVLGKKEFSMMANSSFSSLYVSSHEEEGMVCLVSNYIGKNEFGNAYIVDLKGDFSKTIDNGFVFRNPIPYLIRPSSGDYEISFNIKNGVADRAILRFEDKADEIVYYVISSERIDTWPNTKSGLLNMHRGQ